MNLGFLMVKLATPNGTTPQAPTQVADQSSEGTNKNESRVLGQSNPW